MLGWVPVFARFIVVKYQGLTLFNGAFRKKKDSSFAVNLASHRSDVLFQPFWVSIAVIDAVEEAADVAVGFGDHDKAPGRVG